MDTQVMLVSNPADAFSKNLANWLMEISELGSDLSITERIEEADVVLFLDSYTDPGYHFIRNHPFIAKYRSKCFLFSQLDDPIHVLPGVYANLDLRQHCPGWSSSFCFVDTYRRNPYLCEARELFPSRLFLFSFLGRNSHPIRDKLFTLEFKRSDVVIESTDRYNHWGTREESSERFERRYAEVSAASKFIICPRGAGVSSIRLFEAMELNCVPVIVSDYWVPALGPRWDTFSIRVPERKLDQIEEIIVEREGEWADMASVARQEWLFWFQESNFLKQIVDRTRNLDPTDRDLRRKCELSAWFRLQWRWIRWTVACNLKRRLKSLSEMNKLAEVSSNT